MPFSQPRPAAEGRSRSVSIGVTARRRCGRWRDCLDRCHFWWDADSSGGHRVLTTTATRRCFFLAAARRQFQAHARHSRSSLRDSGHSGHMFRKMIKLALHKSGLEDGKRFIRFLDLPRWRCRNNYIYQWFSFYHKLLFHCLVNTQRSIHLHTHRACICFEYMTRKEEEEKKTLGCEEIWYAICFLYEFAKLSDCGIP